MVLVRCLLVSAAAVRVCIIAHKQHSVHFSE